MYAVFTSAAYEGRETFVEIPVDSTKKRLDADVLFLLSENNNNNRVYRTSFVDFLWYSMVGRSQVPF